MTTKFSYNQRVNLQLLTKSIDDFLGENDKITVLIRPNLPHDEAKVTLTKENLSKIIYDLFPEEHPLYLDFIVENNKIHQTKIQMAGLKYKALESKKEIDEIRANSYSNI